MKSAIDLLCEMKPGPVAESTMSTSMPAVVAGPAAVVQPAATQPSKPKKPKLSDLLKNRKLQQEDSQEKPVIPADAQPDGALPGGQLAPAPKDTVEPPIPTAVALVAPDTTPGAEAALDPSQVPQPAAAPMETPTLSAPNQIDNGNDVMRTLLGTHQSQFKPSLITSPAQAAEAVQRALNGEQIQEGKSGEATMTEAKAQATAASVLAAAQEGSNPAPHHNPQSMNKAIAVTRQLLGMG